MGEITSTRGQRILDAARSVFLPYFGESQIVPKSKVKKPLECIQRIKKTAGRIAAAQTVGIFETILHVVISTFPSVIWLVSLATS